MGTVTSYALVTPARNEAENLARLARSVLGQTILPKRWVVIDQGSTDATATFATRLDGPPPWIRTMTIAESEFGPGAPIVRAFHAGLEELEAPQPDVIVKLDADVSFDADYFARLLEAFDEDPRLGIAGGVCLELLDGSWQPTFVTGHHVRGAVRAYRRECLQTVLPLEERLGWDGVDELKAQVLGWRTRIVPGLSFRHHRSVGARDGGRAKRWVAQGRGAHYMAYRPSYLLFRTLHHALRNPAAVAMIWGYARAAMSREPRYPDATVRRHLRSQQRLRALPLRMREALGKRPG